MLAIPPGPLRAPQLLDQVEHVVGLPFFADESQAAIARAAPNILPPEVTYPRVPLYVAGVSIVVNGRRRFGLPRPPEFTDEQLGIIRTEHAVAIGGIRGELMTLEPDLEPPVVRELRSALETLGADEESKPHSRGRREAEVLPEWELPIRHVNSIVNMSSGGVLQAVRYWDIPAVKRNLPSHTVPEVCVDWKFIHGLVERHGLREDVEEIDWDMLPKGPKDKAPGWEERRDYARELQLRFVPANKLRNVPELRDKLPPPEPLPVARPFHVSRSRLTKLLGGGYHYIDDYCQEHGVGFREMRRPAGTGAGGGRYMTLEEAAPIWLAYNSIPPATVEDITIVGAAKEADVAKYFFRNNLTEAEEITVRDMRAIQPAGRVLPHMPRDVAEGPGGPIERLKRVVLPPHLLPVNVFDKRIPLTYSGVMQHLTRDGTTEQATTLRLIGATHQQSCFEWDVLRDLEAAKGLRPKSIHIDYDRLPTGPEDFDPERIEYARTIQRMLVDHIEQVDTTPVEEWIEQQRTRLERAAGELAVQALTAGESTVEPAAPERVPMYMTSLNNLIADLTPSRRPDRKRAIGFITAHGGNIDRINGTDYVWGIAAGLLRYNFDEQRRWLPQPLADGWLGRNELATLTGQTLQQVDEDLGALDWNALRPELASIGVTASTGNSYGAVHVQWCAPRDGRRLILPHYNPAIVARITQIAAGRKQSQA